MSYNVVDLESEGRVIPIRTEAQILHARPRATDNESAEPRLLAESMDYVAICWKSTQLLLLEKKSANTTTLQCKETIRVVSFVNHSSNTGAVATDNELQVWTVKEALTTSGLVCQVMIRFTLPSIPNSAICNLSFFIEASLNAPNIFLLCQHEAMIVPTAQRIKEHTGQQLATLSASDTTSIRKFQSPVPRGAACAISENGFFAFQVDTCNVVASTGSNNSTPKWACCKEEPVVNLVFVPSDSTGAGCVGSSSLTVAGDEGPAILLASSARMIFEWRLSGTSEPTLTRKMVFGTSPLVAIMASGPTLAVFNANGQLALVDNLHRGDGAGMSVSLYVLPKQVPALPRIAFHRSKQHQQCVLHVLGDTSVECFQWSSGSDFSSSLFRFNNTNSITSTTTTTSSSGTRAMVLPSIAEIMMATSQRQEEKKQMDQENQLGASGPPGYHHYHQGGKAPTAMKAGMISAQADAPHPLTAIAAQGKTMLKEALEPIQTKLQNISEIQDLTIRKQLEDGSKRLISLSLEAQMAELQEYVKTLNKAGPPPGSMAAQLLGDPHRQVNDVQRTNELAFQNYLLSLLKNGCTEIVHGINDGASSALQKDVLRITQASIKSSLRNSQRAIMQRRMDDILSTSTTGVVNRLQKSFSQLKEDVAAEVDRSRNELHALRMENTELRKIISRFMSVRITEEVEALRREVQQLKDTIANLNGGAGMGVSGGFLPPSLNAPSLLDAALLHIREGNAVQGLQHLLSAQDPLLALSLLQQLSTTEFSSLLDNPGGAISLEIWAGLVIQLSKAGTVLSTTGAGKSSDEAATLVELVAEGIRDILTEQDNVMNSSSNVIRQMQEALAGMLNAMEQRYNQSNQFRSLIRDLKLFIR